MNRKRGFSLFEVLIAFAIMSMMLAVLLPGQTRFLARLEPAKESVLALDYAVSLSELAKLGATTPIDEETFTYRNWIVTQSVVAESETLNRLTIQVVTNSGHTLAKLDSFVEAERP